MQAKQVKSKARVAKHGEVFTNPREVNAMLDLVQDQITRIDATFLEPACGSGKFPRGNPAPPHGVSQPKIQNQPYPIPARLGASRVRLYGIELLADNAAECRERCWKPLHSTIPSHFRLPKTIRACWIPCAAYWRKTSLRQRARLPRFKRPAHHDDRVAVYRAQPSQSQMV